MHLYFKKVLTSIAVFTLLGISLQARAESSQDYGDYVIHYTAFRSDTLEPEVAKNYDLTRRNNRIIINIAVLKKVMNTTGKPTPAKVEGNAINLTGQLKQLEFREIKEGTAIYYLAEAKISDGEFFKFELDVTPEGETEPAHIRFDKRFFTY